MLFKLPDLVFEIIIHRFLNYEDRFNLKSTCRRFQTLINLNKFKVLNLFNNDLTSVNNYLIDNENYTNSLINYCSCILKSAKFKNEFVDLQKLIIYYNVYSYIQLDDLNCFENLKHLEIKNAANIYGQLSLKDLKELYIEEILLFSNGFFLDCPNLTTLSLEKEARPILSLDSTINLSNLSIGIYLDHYGKPFEFNVQYLKNLFSQCSNLESVSFKRMTDLFLFIGLIKNNLINSSLLTKITLDSYGFQFNCLSELIDELTSLKKKLKFEFFIESTEYQLNQLKEMLKLYDVYNIQNRRFDNTAPKSLFLNFLNSNQLFDTLFSAFQQISIDEDFKLDEKLIYKLSQLKEIQIDNGFRVSDDLFLLMIKNWNKIEEILIRTSTNLTQQQFDQLPNYLPNLFRFTFQNCKLDNYNFLAKFKKLKKLVFIDEFNLTKNQFLYLIQHCQQLNEIQLFIRNQHILIMIDNQTKSYQISLDQSSHVFFPCLQYLINFLFTIL